MSDTSRIWQRFAPSRPVGWKLRHISVAIIAAVGVLAFAESRGDWSPMHRWNRAVGDMSLLLVSLAMAVGPMARLWSWARRLLPWRREFGIWGTLLAVIHTLIILDGWVEWDLVRLFGYEIHPGLGQYVMVRHGLGLANVIGIMALIYSIILALSSNNWSQRRLGNSVWKFLQQSAYVLWALLVTHTLYFLYIHFQDFHLRVPEPNWLQMPFAALVLVVALLQVVAFWKTLRMKQNGRET